MLLSALFAFAFLLAAEQLLIRDTGWYTYIKKSWPVLICFLFGFISGDNRLIKLLLLIVSVLGAGYLASAGLPWETTFDLVFVAAILAVCVFMFFMGAKHNDSFSSMLTVATVIFYLVELVIFKSESAGVLLPLNIGAGASFILGLFNFNSMNLKEGVHNVKGGTAMPVPSGLRRKNIFLLTGFLTAALLICNLLPIGSAIGTVFKLIAKGIWDVFIFIGGVTFEVKAESTPTPEITSAPEMLLPDVPVNPYAKIFIIIFISSILLIFLIGIILMNKEGLDNILGSIRKLINKNDKGQLDLDFEEDIEKISSFKDAFKKRRKRLGDFLQRLLKKREKFEDMPDNRMKVRYAYKMLLKNKGITKNGTSSTPLELGSRLDIQSLVQLTEDYSAAKYNDVDPVKNAAAENAAAALSDIGKSKVEI